MHFNPFIGFWETVSFRFRPTAYGRQRTHGLSAFHLGSHCLFINVTRLFRHRYLASQTRGSSSLIERPGVSITI